MFKNFGFKDEAELAKLKERVDVPDMFVQAKRLPAGWLIEKAGMKGAQLGGAQVSPQQANYLINTGGATAREVLALAERVKEEVRRQFGVTLQEEAVIV